jgi:hypothetical protein
LKWENRCRNDHSRKELTALPTISKSAEDFTRLEPSASGGSFGEETISITATL